MASSTAPAPTLAAASVRVSKSECRNVVEVVVPIQHDTLRACIEAADAHITDRVSHLQIEDIPALASKLASQDAEIASARSDSFVYAFLFG
ncbi:hypothetical protein [Methylobacterium sp. ARG-1]|uniref:hypothetical protein n=1 Tax=Methylobacterium sp. ARG-1 TaxID=1692501 RepID=UPI000681845E|nr:hypothetical protein [Methylobacterium sp. ARG-1]KNY21605.1 hypothetical protein AKJ13_15235 [Methylobacterium sp. ARG-1]